MASNINYLPTFDNWVHLNYIILKIYLNLFNNNIFEKQEPFFISFSRKLLYSILFKVVASVTSNHDLTIP